MKNLLKVRRWEVGMKQYELANRLGCSASYLSMVETGRIEPSEEFKAKAAATLNMKVEELFPVEMSACHDENEPYLVSR